MACALGTARARRSEGRRSRASSGRRSVRYPPRRASSEPRVICRRASCRSKKSAASTPAIEGCTGAGTRSSMRPMTRPTWRLFGHAWRRPPRCRAPDRGRPRPRRPGYSHALPDMVDSVPNLSSVRHHVCALPQRARSGRAPSPLSHPASSRARGTHAAIRPLVHSSRPQSGARRRHA